MMQKKETVSGRIADNFSVINCNTGEVRGIARNSAPIHVIVHYPKTEEGRHELAVRAAGVHADMVGQYINRLNCPSEQKIQLIDEIIHSAVKEKTD